MLSVQLQKAKSRPRVNNDSDKNIIALLKLLFAKTGLKEVPNEFHTKVLINHMKEELKEYSLQDIRIAFDLGVKNLLNTDINHYQNFSCLYLSNIMNAYKNYLREINYKKQEEKKIELTVEQKEEIVKNGCIIAFEQYKETRVLFDFGDAKYRYLKKKNVLSFTYSEVKAFKEAAEKMHIQESDFSKKLRKEVEKVSRENQIKSRLRKLLLKDCFDSLIEYNIDIKTLL